MRSAIFFASIALLLALAAPARAERDGATLDRILPEIRAAHPGRLSDAQPWIDDNGRAHYRIKWMTPEGRILYFDADARTGHFSSSGGDAGENWRRGGRDWRTDSDDRPPVREDRGRERDNWNGDGGGGPGWREHHGDGDWRGGRGSGDNGGWHHHGHGGH
jgi:hypothetical protein